MWTFDYSVAEAVEIRLPYSLVLGLKCPHNVRILQNASFGA